MHVPDVSKRLLLLLRQVQIIENLFNLLQGLQKVASSRLDDLGAIDHLKSLIDVITRGPVLREAGPVGERLTWGILHCQGYINH